MAEKSVTQPGSSMSTSENKKEEFLNETEESEYSETGLNDNQRANSGENNSSARTEEFKRRKLNKYVNETAPSVINGDYVLIIGGLGLLKDDDNISDADKLILERAHKISQELAEFNSPSDETLDNRKDCFVDYNRYCHDFKEDAKDCFDMAFSDMYKDYDISKELNPAVVRLIESKSFRVVLTTSPSPIIERIMYKVWGDSLEVLSLSSQDKRDINLSDIIDGDKSLMPPTLYYIFGRPDNNNSNYALNDNEKIEKMKIWLGSEAPENILKYVRIKKLFAYGCKFDDWFFRFLWHAFRDQNNIGQGDVALPFDIKNSKEDMRLRDYLSSYNVHIVDEPELYIACLADRIAASVTEFKGRNKIDSNTLHRHVFISYTHRDYVNAMRIYNRLAEEKIPVWLDHYKLGGGDEFDKEINNGIESCGVFLPILSSNVRTDSEKILAWKNDSSLPEPKENQSYYRANEWARGCDANAEWKVIPVTTFGYDYTKDYHYQVVPEKMRAVTVFDWTKQPVSELVERIRKALKSCQS